jgi:hypothetical protein
MYKYLIYKQLYLNTYPSDQQTGEQTDHFKLLHKLEG